MCDVLFLFVEDISYFTYCGDFWFYLKPFVCLYGFGGLTKTFEV